MARLISWVSADCGIHSHWPSIKTAWTPSIGSGTSIKTDTYGLPRASLALRVLVKALIYRLAPSHKNQTGVLCGCAREGSLEEGAAVARRARIAWSRNASSLALVSLPYRRSWVMAAFLKR